MRVLIAEDDLLVAAMALEVVESVQEDYGITRVVHAPDFATSVRLLQEAETSLIICDFEFPGRDVAGGGSPTMCGGVDLYGHVTEHYPTCLSL